MEFEHVLLMIAFAHTMNLSSSTVVPCMYWPEADIRRGSCETHQAIFVTDQARTVHTVVMHTLHTLVMISAWLMYTTHAQDWQ